MTTAVRQSNGNVRVYVKGTPNIILPMCSKYYDASSKEVNLTDKMRQNILSQEGIIGKFANESLRCVAIGYVEYKKAEWAMHTK
jgi:magnesium-transporting ATPase (P-type)